MLNNKTYQLIFDEIIDFLPDDWEKLVVYLEHGEESYSYSFYVKSNGEYTKCFDLQNIYEKDLLSAFSEIEKNVSEERNNSKDELWSNMTMVIDNKGNMKTDFDYSDLSGGNYHYKESWKKKYLGD